MRTVIAASDLTAAVEQLVAEIGPALGRLDRSGQALDRDELEQLQPLRDALELSRAFIDVDGLYTDEELQAFIDTFGPRVESVALRHATAQELRNQGVFRRARTWLEQPSALFERLLDLDASEGSDYSWRYHDAAIRLATCVFELDGYLSPAESAALERWRAMLLGHIQHVGIERRHHNAPTRPHPSEQPDPEEGDLDTLLAELDALIGLAPVKEQVRQVSNLLRVQQMRAERGLATPDTSHHLVFTGNPGTGKTTVARLIARIYRELGVVSQGHLVETDRAGLVAGYVGQTATRVDELVEEALGGVLLVDEAYGLVRGGNQDYGLEALDALVKRMEDHRDDLIVIVAGYPDEMDDFLDANPGLRSRFGRIIHFPDYSDEELLQIFELLAVAADYTPTEDARAAVCAALQSHGRGRGFGNGRLSRTLFEHAVLEHATRVAKLPTPTHGDLTQLRATDIPKH